MLSGSVDCFRSHDSPKRCNLPSFFSPFQWCRAVRECYIAKVGEVEGIGAVVSSNVESCKDRKGSTTMSLRRQLGKLEVGGGPIMREGSEREVLVRSTRIVDLLQVPRRLSGNCSLNAPVIANLWLAIRIFLHVLMHCLQTCL
jgi:hypothetical protein